MKVEGRTPHASISNKTFDELAAAYFRNEASSDPPRELSEAARLVSATTREAALKRHIDYVLNYARSLEDGEHQAVAQSVIPLLEHLKATIESDDPEEQKREIISLLRNTGRWAKRQRDPILVQFGFEIMKLVTFGNQLSSI